MLQLFKWTKAPAPAELRAQIEAKRTQLQEIKIDIQDAQENANDALRDNDIAFSEYWQQRGQELQAQADALESELTELADTSPQKGK